MFQIDDYELLERFLGSYSSLVTTPHVLTEVSNHAHHLKGPLGEGLLSSLALFARESEEVFASSRILSHREEFIRFGLTDCALSDCSNEVTVITSDFRLAGHLEAKGRYVVNFNHLRQSRLLH
jgi:hypothetical protein